MSDNGMQFGIGAERESLTNLGGMLYSLLPEGAVELVFVTRGATALKNEYTMKAVYGDGSEDYPSYGFEVSRAVDQLRATMYRPGVGTWFSARFVVAAQGSMDAEYNYDDEPRWDVDVVPGTYADDLERFPRDPEHIPAWLQGKLDEAAAEDS